MGNLSGFGGHLGNDLGEFEEVRVSAFERQTVRIVMDIIDHWLQLIVRMKNTK